MTNFFIKKHFTIKSIFCTTKRVPDFDSNLHVNVGAKPHFLIKKYDFFKTLILIIMLPCPRL